MARDGHARLHVLEEQDEVIFVSYLPLKKSDSG
jgi:hypothetical protein